MTILVMTALPSFGHGMPAENTVISAAADHAGDTFVSAASCPGMGCLDMQFATCADLTATHCLTGFHPPEAGQSVSPSHTGLLLFKSPEAQLRGISPAAETPPPRT